MIQVTANRRVVNRLFKQCLLPVALLLLLGLSACFKEKNLQPPNNQNRGNTAVINMGPEYNDQFFYSLATNSVVKQNSRFAYDLMFDCNADKFHIWLNTAKFMSVKRMNQTSLDSVVLRDTIGGDWHFELGEFNPDSNAIGDWWSAAGNEPPSAGKVYLIQLGIDNEGNSFGYIKLKVDNFYGDTYSITWSDFVSAPKTKLVQKDASRAYRYLNVQTNSLLDDIEPPKTDWDLCFTRYSVFFYDPYYIPYLVTGVLHNPERVQAYLDSTVVFDSVKLSTFNQARLLSRRDAIGYEWKRVSSLSVNATYTMNLHYTYYIRADADKLYKLRFIDFFNQSGIKGYPLFEYYQLQ